MAVSRKFQIAALGLLSALLILGFFFLYLRSSEGAPLEITDAAPATENNPAAVVTDSTSQPEVAAELSLRVYIAGAVRVPDVYTLKPGDRLVDALRAAGGGAANADLEAVNLALRVQDEGYYYIPAKAIPARTTVTANSPATSPEALPQKQATVPPQETSTVAIPPIAADPLTGELMDSPGKNTDAGDQNGLIDLNTAEQQQLETLPSIGPARAQAIIAHRKKNGPFTTIEELTDVSGIADGIFSKLQHLITVEQSP